MKKTLIEGTGVTGVALELNLRDVIALQDTVVTSLEKRARFQKILEEVSDWKKTATFQRMNSEGNTEEVSFSSLKWEESRSIMDAHFRDAYPNDIEEFSTPVTESDFSGFIARPFDNKQLDALYTFLKKLDTGVDCQATIFTEE